MMSDRPNLLLIWTDEQRADTMACYGNDFIQTPNMNRLASESFVFENAYCAQPVCTPSRATIMSGLYPHTHGCVINNTPLPAETQTIAELAGDDWRRAYFGKWHLGDEIAAQHGFKEWVSCEDGIYRNFYSKPEMLECRSDYHHYLVANGFVPDAWAKDKARVFSRGFAAVMTEKFTKAGFLGRRAADFISQQSADQPFMLSVNFLEPHMPFFGPYNDRHDPAAIPVGPTFAKPPGDDVSLRNRLFSANYRQTGFGQPLKTEQDWRRLRANYYGLTTLVDDAVGRILDALEASGLADNTIVVFTSDHGDLMGDHGSLAKCVMYEESVRIPLMIRVPQLGRKQTMIPGRVSQIDLVPTMMDLLGCDLPQHLQGKSRAGVLRGEENLADNDVVVEWNAMPLLEETQAPGFTQEDVDRTNRQNWRTIITHEGWKLNISDDDIPELFDLNTDPHEMTNRATDPACADIMADLRSRIAAWQKRTGDTLALPA